MKNFMFTIIALMSLSVANAAALRPSVQQNTPPQYNVVSDVEHLMKPKITITISFRPLVVVIEVGFIAPPGGNDNATGNIAATGYGIKEQGIKKGIQENGLTFTVSPEGQRVLAGAKEIVVTKGAVCPDGRIINIGDRIVVSNGEYSIVAPRDAASGMATGKR